MKEFALYEPTTVSQAVALLNKYGPKSKLLAGGTDLVSGVMKDWVSGKGMPYPEHLVDVTNIPEMKGIKTNPRGVTIGAATVLSDVIESAEIQKSFPLLRDAALSVASPQIRNAGTLGGNINQRPRCWFFRGENFACYKKGGDLCFSVTGDNTYHAVIGGELCYIVHPSDTATALLALNASGSCAGPTGARTVPFDNYFISPREDVLRENVLKHDEILVDVTIPRPAPGTKMAWKKLKQRQVYDFALVSVAVAFTLDGTKWKDGRIVLGGVAPMPYRAKAVEEALAGKDVKATVQQAAAAIRRVARPLSQNGYKVDIAQGLIERTILEAMG
jgi:xanthine dehydrogenase YagS FAD-binding subunit